MSRTEHTSSFSVMSCGHPALWSLSLLFSPFISISYNINMLWYYRILDILLGMQPPKTEQRQPCFEFITPFNKASKYLIFKQEEEVATFRGLEWSEICPWSTLHWGDFPSSSPSGLGESREGDSCLLHLHGCFFGTLATKGVMRNSCAQAKIESECMIGTTDSFRNPFIPEP